MPLSKNEIEEVLIEHRSQIRMIVAKYASGLPGLTVEDIEQEVKIRLWKVLLSERKILYLTSYISKIVRNAAIDVVRQAARRPQLTSMGDDEEGIHGASIFDDRPSDDLENQLLLREVDHCIGQLPNNRRSAVRLHLQGFTSIEIAQRCAWSEAKARNLASRGMLQLRELLTKQGIHYESE